MRNMLKCASLGIRAIRFSSSGSSVASWNRGSFNRFSPNCRSFCSGEGEEPNSKDDTEITKGKQAEDVKTKEILKELRTYYSGGGKEEHLDSVAQVVMKRALHGNHDESDEELMDKMRFQPVKDVHDSEFESDFSEENDTDHEIDNLYNATEYVEQKIMQDDTVNMSAEQYDEVVKELQDKGYVIDNEGYEQIMEDMLNWNDILPDELKEKIEAKFNELGNMCEQGELEPEEAFDLFKEFEELMVQEYAQKMPAEKIPQDTDGERKRYKDDPPGEGPILRWETRVVLGPGEAWHPANRKVKVSVYVKELGLSKYAARRLRALVGKRYHPGKDELTIVSERFAHREENRKDVLRTLYALIEDAEKADTLVAEARTAYMKERLKANPEFQERLRAQAAMLTEPTVV